MKEHTFVHQGALMDVWRHKCFFHSLCLYFLNQTATGLFVSVCLFVWLSFSGRRSPSGHFDFTNIQAVMH